MSQVITSHYVRPSLVKHSPGNRIFCQLLHHTKTENECDGYSCFPLLLKCVYVCKTARKEHFLCANTFGTSTTTTGSHKNRQHFSRSSEINTIRLHLSKVAPVTCVKQEGESASSDRFLGGKRVSGMIEASMGIGQGGGLRIMLDRLLWFSALRPPCSEVGTP